MHNSKLISCLSTSSCVLLGLLPQTAFSAESTSYRLADSATAASNRSEAASSEETGASAGSNSPDESAEQSPFEYEYFEELIEPIEGGGTERLCGLDKVCVTLWKKGKLQIYKEGRLLEGDFNNNGIPDEAIVLEKDLADATTNQNATDTASDAKGNSTNNASKHETTKTGQATSNSVPLGGTGKEYWILISEKTPELSDPTSAAAAVPATATANAEKSNSSVPENPNARKHKLLLHEKIPDAFNIVDFFVDAKKNALVVDIGERIMHTTSSMGLDPSATLGASMQGITQKVVVVIAWNSQTQKFDIIEPVKSHKQHYQKKGESC